MSVTSIQRYKVPPFEHQRIGTEALVKNAAFALFDEMGAGKSKQVIDAACILAEQGKIDTVLVVAPAGVRCVWVDAEIGEIGKHSWAPNCVLEFHAKIKHAWHDVDVKLTDPHAPILTWLVTNYEFLRSEKHLTELCSQLRDCKTLLVLDESSYIKNRTAQQTKAIKKLRKHCARCVLLNGTPITNSPLDLWSQMQILDPRILERDFKNYYNFRSEYCEMVTRRMGMARFQEVVRYKRLDDLTRRLAPYVLRREKKDCLDLPPKLYTEREVPLMKESWKRYQELKKECLLALPDGNMQLEPNAAVRIMRLAQLTSGILGGAAQEVEAMMHENRAQQTEEEHFDFTVARDLSDEKLRWAVRYLTEECTAKAVIVWCRWRRERERLFEALVKANGNHGLCQIYGGQSSQERENAIRGFSTCIERNVCQFMLAQPHAGGHGLNLVAASEAIYLSNDFALGIRLQSEDRCHRPGQVNRVLYTDVLATGPNGERTVDHVIAKALREKKHLAMMTCAEWRKELEN